MNARLKLLVALIIAAALGISLGARPVFATQKVSDGCGPAAGGDYCCYIITSSGDPNCPGGLITTEIICQDQGSHTTTNCLR
jgi:hypothetical protein